MKIILASGSQRRKELMTLMGLDFQIIPSGADEHTDKTDSPHEFVCELARRKAEFVARTHGDACVIGADTIVVLDGVIIGKPKDETDAYRILRALSGREHTVYTGLTVICGDDVQVEYDATKVTFSELTDEDIYTYIASGDPMDKAGSYGIQGKFCVHIERIEGSYFNVIGLPVHVLHRMLKSVDAI
ncbi:MAG: septum formation inhibitor Maf [Clostridia bacterium]|nr:septum formation inhibitor Maf [Clostridia bacterium]